MWCIRILHAHQFKYFHSPSVWMTNTQNTKELPSEEIIDTSWEAGLCSKQKTRNSGGKCWSNTLKIQQVVFASCAWLLPLTKESTEDLQSYMTDHTGQPLSTELHLYFNALCLNQALRDNYVLSNCCYQSPKTKHLNGSDMTLQISWWCWLLS